MLDLKEKLTILIFDNVLNTFEEKTLFLNQFKEENEVSFTFDNTKDIYIGFSKPIKNFYVHLKTPSLTDMALIFQHSTTSGMTAIPNVFDETRGFSKSGFIQYEEIGVNNFSVNGMQKYWIKISSPLNSEEISLCAINMLLNSIYDLTAKYPQINEEDFLLGKASLHVAIENARNEIVARLVRLGIETNQKTRITVFDLLDIQEIREASTCLTLANIFEMVSDNNEDKFFRLSKAFFKKYDDSIKLFTLTIDKNQTGIQENQKSQILTGRLIR